VRARGKDTFGKSQPLVIYDVKLEKYFANRGAKLANWQSTWSWKRPTEPGVIWFALPLLPKEMNFARGPPGCRFPQLVTAQPVTSTASKMPGWANLVNGGCVVGMETNRRIPKLLNDLR
jgi:hypothetical protein